MSGTYPTRGPLRTMPEGPEALCPRFWPREAPAFSEHIPESGATHRECSLHCALEGAILAAGIFWRCLFLWEVGTTSRAHGLGLSVTHSLLQNGVLGLWPLPKEAIQTMCVSSLSRVTLWDPVVCSPPGCSVHGISQARVLEWIAIPFSRASSRPRDQTRVPGTAGGFFTI